LASNAPGDDGLIDPDEELLAGDRLLLSGSETQLDKAAVSSWRETLKKAGMNFQRVWAANHDALPLGFSQLPRQDR